jgi:hypothetical protein
LKNISFLVYLTQKADAKIEECTTTDSASELPQGTACSFDWSRIVNTDNHPCSEKNLFGFKNEQPCVLVKLNKVINYLFQSEQQQNSF